MAPDSPIGFNGRSGGSILDAYQALYARAVDGTREAGGFGELVLWRYDWERSYTRDELVDLVSTSGGLSSLPADRAAEMLAALGGAVDELGGMVTLPYATWGLSATRTDVPPRRSGPAGRWQ